MIKNPEDGVGNPLKKEKHKMSNRRFSPDQEIEICNLYFKNKLSQRQIAEQAGCSQQTIGNIIKRRGYKARGHLGCQLRRGSYNSNWRGGRIHSGTGYIRILRPDHPNADKQGYVFEHRLIMEKHLGRFLKKEEVVHHIDGNKRNNRRENLKLFKNESEHQKWETKGKKQSQLLQKDFA